MSLFHTVTGADFARSFRWAAKGAKRLRDYIPNYPTMKIITKAKFFSGPTAKHWDEQEETYKTENPYSITTPAIIELDGLQWSSPVPKTAAEAERINGVVAKWSALGVTK